MNLQRKKILSTVQAGNFIGRSRELDDLLRHAKGDSVSPGRLLLSAPFAGASELLRQVYDQLFFEQGQTIPFYFALRKSDRTAGKAALRFLQAFLLQVVAYRRRDPKILDSSPDINELAEIAVPADGYWIDRLIETSYATNGLNDERAFIKEALSAPLRAAAHGAKVLVMVDDLHEVQHLRGEIDFLEELKEIYSRAGIPFIFAGNRRFLFKKIECEALSLGQLTFSDAGLLAENLSGKYGVAINEQTRDLIATQLQGNPSFIGFLFKAAKKKGKDLDSFQRVQQFYTDELMGGGISKVYDRVFAEWAPNADLQKNILGLIYDTLALDNERVPVESWQNRTGLDDDGFYRVMNMLNSAEIIRLSSGHVEAADENHALTDYVGARFRLEIVGENRALVVGETLTGFLKRAPKLMANFYRRNSSLGLRELMSVFDCQEVSPALIDYGLFRDEFTGAPDDEVLRSVVADKERVRLPQIIYTAHTAAVYRAINQVTEKERSAVALGFEESKYTDEDEIVWIGAEIDSKLEASKDLVEFWCDRLEMVALMCNFVTYKLWLVAPEGFSREALDVLNQRNAYGSSRRQVELLIKALKAEEIVGEKLKANEYEMIVPMGDDTELIAAHAIEEIAKRHHFQPKAINQIKTALVEACINATEHSHSPDRKIYQRFTVEDDRIVITISNRGLRLADKKAVEVSPNEGRRGWGLKLMKSLMDEVKLEQVDDGTRISMTKYLRK
jgi:serine/threonine-protein kinase RsbW